MGNKKEGQTQVNLFIDKALYLAFKKALEQKSPKVKVLSQTTVVVEEAMKNFIVEVTNEQR